MKYFNWTFSVLLLAFGLLAVTSVRSGASVVARSPKKMVVGSYSILGTTVTPTISTNAVTAAAEEPGAVYQIQLSSGAAAEYVVMFDSGNCTGLTAASTTNQVAPRVFFVGTTSGTIWTYDPPVTFSNGLCVYDSAATGQWGISYELGRGLSGN